MGARRWGNAGRGFGRRQPRRSYEGTDWLSPAAYNALSREEKMALAARRHQQKQFHKPRVRRKSARVPAVLVLLPIFAAVAWFTASGWSPQSFRAATAPVSHVFASCHTGGGTNCVVDGDTFWMDGVKIRIAGIDAPETHPPHCARESELGFAASRRLRELLNSGPVTLSSIDRDEDRYGRKLRNVAVNGSDVGETLISEGLAREYAGGRRPWC